ncbi:colanic acid biosynthesis glycosyl transferase WcaI [Mycobacterium sp. MAA66]|uniref:glycosyltransferase family 4 protein n=1 Tax=Mycobacterium sp. MAA66 TaxID=3156297 RepID=UPI0035154181
MRVLIVGLNYAPEPSGNAPYTSGLAAGLKARGHDVHVLAGLPHYPAWKIEPGYARRRAWIDTVESVPVQRLPHYVPDPPSQRGRLLMELSFGLKTLLLRWPDHDAIVFVSPGLIPTAMGMLRAKFRFRRPAIGIWIQDLYSRGVVETGLMSGRSAGLVGTLESRSLKAADGVAAIHDRFKAYLVSELAVQPDSVKVIRNWTHLRPYELKDRAGVRSRLGWRSDETVVLHAGNMGNKQGLENVVHAARAAQERAAPVRFVLLGDGNQRELLEQLGANISTLQFIRPLPDDEFKAAMGAADILLVQEKSGVGEMSVPSKMTSYFTTGNPVIAATDAGSITAQEITVSGAGVVVGADDPDELVDAAINLGSDPERARKLGAAGQQFCAQTLSMDHAIDQYEEWIRALVDRRNQSTTATTPQK